jgi:hypothetical protein
MSEAGHGLTGRPPLENATPSGFSNHSGQWRVIRRVVQLDREGKNDHTIRRSRDAWVKTGSGLSREITAITRILCAACGALALCECLLDHKLTRLAMIAFDKTLGR